MDILAYAYGPAVATKNGSDGSPLPTSTLPPGGSPAIDAAYESWLIRFVAEQNVRFVDRYLASHRSFPRNELLRTYQLTGHLFKWLVGWDFPSGTGPNVLHRLRFVAVQFALRKDALVEESESYAAQLCEAAISPD